MTTVTLDDRAAKALEKLRHRASARGISLDRYLAELADSGERTTDRPRHRLPHDLTLAEFRQWLLDLSAGMPPLPSLPEDFSRADIYDDHD